MEGIAPRLRSIKPSPSLAVAAKAGDMCRAGIDVVSLAIGEPDFATPEHIVQATVEAMRRGETRYTPVDGTAKLKNAILEKFRRDNGLNYETSQVAVASGAKQVVFNALLATLAPGDEVIIPAPYWVSYPDIVRIGEGRPVVVTCGADDGFKLSPLALEKAITEKTRWLILNSPSNPTGALYSATELAALGEVLLRHPHVLILSDEIYEHIVFPGAEFRAFASAVPALKDRTLTVNGVSKAYSMTGWRIGYGAGPAWLIKAMGVLQSQSTSNPCSISQAAAVAALEGPQDFLEGNMCEFRSRRDVALRAISKINGLFCEPPDGAFYLFADCSELLGTITQDDRKIISDHDLALYFLDVARVAVVEGSAFGLAGHMRFSTATSLTKLSEAFARIERVVADLRR